MSAIKKDIPSSPRPDRFRLLDHTLQIALPLLGIPGAGISVYLATFMEFYGVPYYKFENLRLSLFGRVCGFAEVPIVFLFLFCAIGLLLLRLTEHNDKTMWKPRRVLTILTILSACVMFACFLAVPFIAWVWGIIAEEIYRFAYFF